MIDNEKNAKTCEELFKKTMAWVTAHVDGPMLFSAGYIVGQAEKVYIGACRACMARPCEEYFENTYLIAEAVAEIYELQCNLLAYADGAGHEHIEIWIYENGAQTTEDMDILFWSAGLLTMSAMQRNAWHQIRGRLCGI